MPDVYVEVGTAKLLKSVPNAYAAPAQAGLRKAVTNAVRKINSGMTTVKPADGKGIQVNIHVTKLAQDGNQVTCALIGELYELPGKQRFTDGGSPNGQASVPGKIDAVAEDCVAKAVGDLMDKITPGIVTSQNAPARAGTVNAKSPLIFIAPFDISYPKTATAAPQDLSDRAIAAIGGVLEKKFKANPKRFTLDDRAFKRGSGMPAYLIGIAVETLAFDASAGELVAETKAYIADYPGRSMIVPRVGSRSRMKGLTKPPRDADKIMLLLDAAESTADKAIEWMLKTHP
jgi:hypothetical protein